MILQIAKDFCMTPGPAYRSEGSWSGEEFREDFLEPILGWAVKNGVEVTIDLDGVAGYAGCFLDEAFGGLMNKFSFEQLLETIYLQTSEFPELFDEIHGYVEQNDIAPPKYVMFGTSKMQMENGLYWVKSGCWSVGYRRCGGQIVSVEKSRDWLNNCILSPITKEKFDKFD